MIKILIPSYQRAGKVRTLQMIPESYRKYTHLIVRAEEYEAYRKHYGDECLIVTVRDVSNMGETRQRMVEMFAGQRVWSIDDDTLFHKTFEDKAGIIRPNKAWVSEDEWYELIDYVNGRMDDRFPHGGIPLAIFPKRWATDWPYRANTYYFTNLWLNLEVLKTTDFECDKWSCMDDAYTYMSLIEKGHDACCLQNFLGSQPESNAPGGCSTYRTSELWNAKIRELVARFPMLCRIKTKTGKLNLQGTEPAITIVMQVSKRLLDSNRRLKGPQ
jgi:hypothetical protein